MNTHSNLVRDVSRLVRDVHRLNMRVMWTADDVDHVLKFIESPLGIEAAKAILIEMKERLVSSIIR